MTYTILHDVGSQSFSHLSAHNLGLGALQACTTPPAPAVEVIEIRGLDAADIKASVRLVTACEITSA